MTPEPVALLVTSPQYPCLAKYVVVDGQLGDAPVFQSPAEWGTVYAFGNDIRPGVEYRLQLDFNTGEFTEPRTMQAWLWGDVDNNGIANFGDIYLTVQGFQLDFSNATLYAMDLGPCTPNQVVNFLDVMNAISAFGGSDFDSSADCPETCPEG